MTATSWTHAATLRHLIEAADEDAAQIPKLLLAMAAIVGPIDSSFAEELQEAAEDAEFSETATEDADFWLSQFYQWADTMRVWIG